jgi:tight adherence protein B
LNQALDNLNKRMENDDLYLVVTAISINTQVGGNLITMLEAVTRTIRERVRLFAEVRVLTSQQRFNSYILTLLPFAMGALLFVINPTYMERLFEPGIFLCIPIGAGFNMILGNIIIRRMAKIEV